MRKRPKNSTRECLTHVNGTSDGVCVRKRQRGWKEGRKKEGRKGERDREGKQRKKTDFEDSVFAGVR